MVAEAEEAEVLAVNPPTQLLTLEVAVLQVRERAEAQGGIP